MDNEIWKNSIKITEYHCDRRHRHGRCLKSPTYLPQIFLKLLFDFFESLRKMGKKNYNSQQTLTVPVIRVLGGVGSWSVDRYLQHCNLSGSNKTRLLLVNILLKSGMIITRCHGQVT